MPREIILFLICLFFVLLFIANIIKFNQQNKQFEKQLMQQNKELIFINNSNLNLKIESYQPNNFLLMQNTGSNPCNESKFIKYISYSKKEDYYLKNEE